MFIFSFLFSPPLFWKLSWVKIFPLSPREKELKRVFGSKTDKGKG
jgi:hypothetical protein